MSKEREGGVCRSLAAVAEKVDCVIQGAVFVVGFNRSILQCDTVTLKTASTCDMRRTLKSCVSCHACLPARFVYVCLFCLRA